MRTFAMRGNYCRYFHFHQPKILHAMTQEITHPILHKAIKNLDVSKEFKAMAKTNGFKTLQDILETPLHELPHRPQSGYRMLKEFLDIIEAYSLSMLIAEND